MHISAFTGFGNVSRSKIQSLITFFFVTFFWPCGSLFKFRELYFKEHTKNNKGRPGIRFRPYLITSIQDLNDFRLLVLSKEFGFVINLVKKLVVKTAT